ncbi:ANTAR domain-containing response regulator [Psychromonas sp. SR45-3]|uniref:ANTAR domain-containing response regulator n=1 Tax=Psychromonas sp. SR45-3 TaxID=2760930 RepID=UPI0015FB364F|nr:ANTAR domain-containing protein [Psychromonas sp. SR45-3]MBB1274865.1 ANTAR domain-containing protein [Psychromonas sp. SR45-3]
MMKADRKLVTSVQTRSVLLVEDVIMKPSPLKIALQELGYTITKHIQTNNFKQLSLKTSGQQQWHQQIQKQGSHHGKQSTKNKIAAPLFADLLIINSNSPDELLLTVLENINQLTPLPIILFTKNQTEHVIHASIKVGVSSYIIDAVDPTRLSFLMMVAEAQFKQRQSLCTELDKTRAQLANRKIVERAKGYLMQQKGITEQDAFVLLRTMAMNNGQTLATVSQNVTDIYSLDN